MSNDPYPPGQCPEPRKHVGLFTTVDALKAHLVAVHGWPADYWREAARRMRARVTCPRCNGAGVVPPRAPSPRRLSPTGRSPLRGQGSALPRGSGGG